MRIALLVLCALAPASHAVAAGADELFADGNRLFRDDLYWAALLRYQQAEAAGLDTPLLQYNTGVAHYRAGQFGRARHAFQRAAADVSLEHAAHYNLGLTAMAVSDTDTALDWFRRVQAQQQYPALAELATDAIQTVTADLQASDPGNNDDGQLREAWLPQGLQLRVSVGVGSDDNAYRSADRPYFDRAQNGNPVVAPVIQSGVYYPFDVTARYSIGSFEHESFYGSYRLMGRYYQDPLLENADEISHELAFGTEFHRVAENRERKIHSAFTVAQHDETWFDPDDGSERIDDGSALGDRLSYIRYGPELWARQSFKRLSLSAHAKGQIWNYDQAADITEYDHELFEGGLSVQYRFTSTSLLRIEGDLRQRRFGDRRAYSRDGTQNIDNPSLRYDYVSLGATARQRLTRSFWFGLRYARSERTDQYLGYNDYFRDSYGAEFSLLLGDRLKVRAEGWYRNYNFVRAYAYQEPAAGRKTMETANARLTAVWRLRDHVSLVGSVDYQEVGSNDIRVQYLQTQYMIGLRWQH